MEIENIIICAVAGLLGGFIGNISGGASLVEIPMLMFFGFPIPTLIGSIKLGNVFGTITAAINFARKGCMDCRLALAASLPTIAAGALGAWMCTRLPKEGLDGIVLAVLLLALLLTLIPRPEGKISSEPRTRSRTILFSIACGILGLYGGFIGATVGTMFILLYLYAIGKNIETACGTGRLLALWIDAGALPVFFCSGSVDLSLALPLTVGSMAGGYIGSSMAMLKGNRLIRFFMVSVILATLLWQLFRTMF